MPLFLHKPTIINCLERHAVEIPLNQLVTSSGALNILPEVAAKGFFDIDYRAGRLTFVAGKYIGLIPINENIFIDVKPKIGVTDLLRVLRIAGEELGTLNFFERDYQEQDTFDETVIHIAVRSLVRQLQNTVQEGLLKQYVGVAESGSFKPRIDFSRTLQKHWCRGNFSQTHNYRFFCSKDNPPNRLIKYTLWYCGNFLTMRAGSEDIRQELAAFYDLFETVPLDHSRRFISQAREALVLNRIPVLRQYYEQIIRTCLFIVGNRSVSLEVQGTDVSLLSFVLNLEDVFEKYIRNTLRSGLNPIRLDAQILDGNRDGRRYLYWDSKTIEIRPDILIRTGRETVLIADVKYKPKIAETDRYQVIAHALSTGAPIAVIVLPTPVGGQSGLVRKGQLLDANGLELYEYYFSLDHDLVQEELKLAESFLTLIPPPQ